MSVKINPFQDLFQGDSIKPNAFIDLFSSVFVEHAIEVFQPGNILIIGSIGSGKSMLLNLLDPEIRVAYEKAKKPFPIAKKFSKFIGAGINLKHSGISQFGQRAIIDEDGIVATPFYFGDFLNYWIVYDIFKTIRYFASQTETSIPSNLGICWNEKNIEGLASAMSEDPNWLGALKSASKIDEILESIKNRIDSYLRFMNYNGEFPDFVRRTKTSVGAPILSTVKLLKKHKIIDNDAQFFVRIDQYEELAYLDEANGDLGIKYQEMTNKLLSLRDTAVSYKIGARPNSWQDNIKKVYGTTGVLEKARDYNEVDIDKKLRLQEEKRGYVFPNFAADIFYRRLMHANYEVPKKCTDLLSYVFVSEPPATRVLRYTGKNPRSAVKIKKEWPPKFKEFLNKLADKDPISARMGEAWVQQKGKEKYIYEEHIEPYPWEEEKKRYWKKERIDQALFQIASRNKQRPIYFGKEEVLGLSGGNILVFISLCKHIWGVWIRDNELDESKEILLPQFDPVIQGMGIRATSMDWLKDVSIIRGGKERLAFLNYLGSMFSEKVNSDGPMSYPGHTGFSLKLEEYNSEPEIQTFLKRASDNGVLYETEHTSRIKGDQARRKWYLNPILYPNFKITYKRIKEPYYATIDEVKEWLLKSQAFKDQSKFVHPIKKATEIDKEKNQLSLL